MILVTGGAGFVGRHVVARLAQHGVPSLVVEHAWRSIDDVEAAISDQTIDHCIHLGWYANPRDYLNAPEQNLGCLRSSIELIDLLVRHGCRHLTVTGTSAEYAPSDTVIRESDRVEPTTIYAATKASLRLLLRSSWVGEAISVAWARVFNVTGPGEHPERLFPSVARAIASGQALDLSAGTQVRDYLDVRDVASALVALSTSGAEGDFNVCSAEGSSVRSLLERVTHRFGEASNLLRFGAKPMLAEQAPFIVGANDRLRLATSWQPRVSVEDSFADLYDEAVATMARA